MDFKFALLIGLLCFALVAGQDNANKKTKKQRKFRSKIIGGKKIEASVVPYTVSVGDAYGHFCGGTVIDANWVVTAAHCLEDVSNPYHLTVTTGSTYVNQGQKFGVCQMVKHPNYNPNTVENDIALLRTCNRLSHVMTMKLATTLPNAGEQGMVTGWGVTSEDSETPSSVLQYLWIPVLDKGFCRAALNGMAKVVDTMICAGHMGGGKDACLGDSGGPFVTQARSGRGYELTGVVSFGVGCARKNMPAVYTAIPYYINWIRAYVNV